VVWIGACRLALRVGLVGILKRVMPIELACWRAFACSEAPASYCTSAASYGYAENIFIVPIVKAELELVQIERQVLCADVVIRADNATLEQRPERFNRIGMDFTAHIFAARMSDRFMREVTANIVIGLVLIGRDQRHFLADGLAHEACESGGVRAAYYPANHIPFALDCADDSDFAIAYALTIGLRAFSIADLSAFLAVVAIAIFAADVSLVNFNDSHKLDKFRVFQASAKPHAHIPSGPIRASADHAVNLKRAHTFLAGQHEKHDFEPDQQWIFGFLENGSGCEREAVGRTAILAALFALPVPETRSLARINVLVIAAGATHAIGPTPIGQIGPAGFLIRKQQVELLQGHLADYARFGSVVARSRHALNIAHNHAGSQLRHNPRWSPV
jgi:hypothetical protein